MDTISIIIITAFVNAVVTAIVSNVIFLRYQKKIEDNFARSYFEYQTRFVRNHEKMMEVLESLCKDYLKLTEHMNNSLAISTRSYAETKHPVTLDTKVLQDFNMRIEKFREQITINRYYLSPIIANKILDSSYRLNGIVALLQVSTTEEIMISGTSENQRYNNILEFNQFEINPINPNDPIHIFIADVMNQLLKEGEQFSNVYRTIANINFEEPKS